MSCETYMKYALLLLIGLLSWGITYEPCDMGRHNFLLQGRMTEILDLPGIDVWLPTGKEPQ